MEATLDTTFYIEYPIKEVKGDTLDAENATFQIKTVLGADVNLTGYDSGKLLVKNKRSDADADAILTFDTSSGGDAVLELGDGFFILRADADAMDLLDSTKTYVWDLKVYIDPLPFWTSRYRRVSYFRMRVKMKPN